MSGHRGQAIPDGGSEFKLGNSLVIGKGSDPIRPLICSHTAGHGPRSICGELAMPLEGPQLLETDLAHGTVGKGTADESAMAVDADPLHATLTLPGIVLVYGGTVTLDDE